MPLSRITSPFQSATANVYSPSANTVAIRTASADRVTVSNTGIVGIGTNVPNAGYSLTTQIPVYINNQNTNITPDSSWSGQLTIRGSGYQGGLAADGTGLWLGHNSASRAIIFATDETERVRITAAGVLDLTTGQLKFPATQNASADPNTLDDYEEGTWTPLFAGGSSNPSVTYSTQDGRYTKIGNRVYFTALIIISSVSGQGTGNILINGLPFAAAGSSYENVCPIGYNDLFFTPFKTAYVNGSQLLIIPVGITQGNAGYGTTGDGLSNLRTGYLGISGFYRV